MPAELPPPREPTLISPPDLPEAKIETDTAGWLRGIFGLGVEVALAPHQTSEPPGPFSTVSLLLVPADRHPPPLDAASTTNSPTGWPSDKTTETKSAGRWV